MYANIYAEYDVLDDSKEVVMPEIVDDIYKLMLDNRIK